MEKKINKVWKAMDDAGFLFMKRKDVAIPFVCVSADPTGIMWQHMQELLNLKLEAHNHPDLKYAETGSEVEKGMIIGANALPRSRSVFEAAQISESTENPDPASTHSSGRL